MELIIGAKRRQFFGKFKCELRGKIITNYFCIIYNINKGVVWFHEHID